MLSLLIMRFKLLGLDAPPKHPTQPPPRCHPCPDWASHRLASCSTQFSASHLLPPRLRSPSGRQARVEDEFLLLDLLQYMSFLSICVFFIQAQFHSNYFIF
uniref:Uncharacterized protein n=1 Tax=Opuntia streptacantha TaxID=393608 RepID=A0A7C9CWU6_OPUST